MSEIIQNDSSLEWVDFQPVASNIPKDVFYQPTTANSANAGGYSFYVLAPATNALLLNDAVIEYNVLIDSSNALALSTIFEAAAGAASNGGINNAANYTVFLRAVSNSRLALRQCWPINRAMQNISLNINGTVFSCQPEIWMDAMNRLYVSEEEAASLCTLSGGEFDSGNRVPMVDTDNTAVFTTAAGQVNNNTLLGYLYQGFALNTAAGATQFEGYTAWPNDEAYYNLGFSKRFHRFALLNRAGGSLTGGSVSNGTANAQTNETDISAASVLRFINGGGTFIITLFERIPICPFLLYDTRDMRMSIPNIRTLTLNVQMDSNYAPLILQGATPATAGATGLTTYGALAANPTLDFYTNKPILHLRWYMTDDPIPQSVTIPAWVIREYNYPFTLAAGSFAVTAPVSGLQTVTYSSINFEGIPDMLFIFAKKLPSTAAYIDPSDHNMEITQLNLTVAGVSGKILNMSSGELYQTWLNNVYHKGVKKMSYQEWRKRNCVAVLRPKDYGALFGPGFNYPIQMTVQANLYSWWNIPAIQNVGSIAIDAGNNVSYALYVVAVYNRYALELNGSGGSRLDLLKVPIHAMKSGRGPNSLLEHAPE